MNISHSMDRIMLKRTIKEEIDRALKISPAVLIAGARQIGKSTIVMGMKREYIVMDDITQFEAALDDPQGYIERLIKPVTLDEIQKVPQLLTPIKYYVDRNRNNGDFLLTGSANVLNLRKANDSLAGRLIELTMYPFSAKEKRGKEDENVLDALFGHNLAALRIDEDAVIDTGQTIIEGGYPVAFQLKGAKERFLWFNSYISTYIERDIRSIGELRGIDNFIRFFNVLTPRSGTLLNKSSIANETNLNAATVDNYLSLLEKVYQVHLLKPYAENIGKRFTKSPKVYMTDSGLFSHILGIRDTDQLAQSRQKGEVYETFVFSELLKHIAYSQEATELYYYRTRDKKEIDFILKRQEKIVAIEVKSASTVGKDDFRHIVDFQDHSSREILGIVLYNGSKVVGFGKNLFAVPIAIFL